MRLLGKCPGLKVVRIGSNDAAADLTGDDAKVVFANYYLDRSFTPKSDLGAPEGPVAWQALLRVLRAVQ